MIILLCVNFTPQSFTAYSIVLFHSLVYWVSPVLLLIQKKTARINSWSKSVSKVHAQLNICELFEVQISSKTKENFNNILNDNSSNMCKAFEHLKHWDAINMMKIIFLTPEHWHGLTLHDQQAEEADVLTTKRWKWLEHSSAGGGRLSDRSKSDISFSFKMIKTQLTVAHKQIIKRCICWWI